MPRGGTRPGSGRKPKLIKFAGPVADAEQRIADKLPTLVDTYLKLALGQIVVQREDNDGVTDLYAVAPEPKALTYLIDRIMGKPTERIEADVDVNDGVTIIAELDDETRQKVRAALLGKAAS